MSINSKTPPQDESKIPKEGHDTKANGDAKSGVGEDNHAKQSEESAGDFIIPGNQHGKSKKS